MLRVAASQYPITWHANWDGFSAKIDLLAQEAASGGARLLVMPEYGSMELASLLAEDDRLDLARQLRALQALHGAYLDLHAAVARRHGLYVLAASFPVRVGDGYRNRAAFFASDGRHAYQDKLVMTRFEDERWHISAGEALRVFDTAIGTIGVAVCYDAEFPLIVRAQAEAGADLILVPSCTDTHAGYHRVRIGAQARALENQCFTVQSPTVGDAPWSPAVDVNVGAAGAFAPMDSAISVDGVLALGRIDEPGLVYADLDMERLRWVRENGEVFNSRDWPRQISPATGGAERIRL